MRWYEYECWEDRPSFLFEISAGRRYVIKLYGRKKIIEFVVSRMILMVAWIIYLVTLPFAFINEWVRRL